MQLSYKKIGYIVIGLGLLLLLILLLVKFNVDKEGAFLCQVVEASPELTMDQCPAHGSSSSWLLLLGFAVVFVIIASGVYLISMPTTEDVGKSEARVVDLPSLDDEEKRIYGLIQSSEGSAYQSDLIKETGLSKVKISRI